MAIALVQTASKTAGSVNTSTLAFPGNVTAGSLLVAYVYKGDVASVLGASDGPNGAYHNDVSLGFSGSSGGIFTVANAAGGATTVTFTGTGIGSLQCVLEEWSGVATSTPLDKTQSATFSTSSAPTSGATATTSQANELVLGLVAMDTGQAVTPGTGYTLGTNANAFHEMQEYRIVSSSNMQTANFTLGAADSGVALVATYKDIVPGVSSRGGVQELLGVGS